MTAQEPPQAWQCRRCSTCASDFMVLVPQELDRSDEAPQVNARTSTPPKRARSSPAILLPGSRHNPGCPRCPSASTCSHVNRRAPTVDHADHDRLAAGPTDHGLQLLFTRSAPNVCLTARTTRGTLTAVERPLRHLARVGRGTRSSAIAVAGLRRFCPRIKAFSSSLGSAGR